MTGPDRVEWVAYASSSYRQHDSSNTMRWTRLGGRAVGMSDCCIALQLVTIDQHESVFVKAVDAPAEPDFNAPVLEFPPNKLLAPGVMSR